MKKMPFCLYAAAAVLVWAALPACDSGGPRIGAVRISGILERGIGQPVMLSCAVLGASAAEIASVTADLRAMGGSADTELSSPGNDVWQWSGTVTPPQKGTVKIVVTAKDSAGRKGAAETTAEVIEPAQFTPEDGGNLYKDEDGRVGI